MNNPEKKMTNVQLYSILLAFLAAGLISTYFPISSSIHLVDAIKSHSDKISFEKGSYYLFGGGLILIIVPIWAIYTLAINQKHNEKFFRRMMIFLAVCFISIFILPQIMSVSVGDYLGKRGYTYCDKLSRQWLFNRTMVYTKNKCVSNVSSDR